jgi:hypothetical protein
MEKSSVFQVNRNATHEKRDHDAIYNRGFIREDRERSFTREQNAHSFTRERGGQNIANERSFTRRQGPSIRYPPPPIMMAKSITSQLDNIYHEAAKMDKDKVQISLSHPLTFVPSVAEFGERKDSFAEHATNFGDPDKFRADYRVKFSCLKQAYAELGISDNPFSDDDPPAKIKELFDSYVKKVYIDSSVAQNKIYLLIAWIIIEATAQRWIGVTLSNYTMTQIENISRYQGVLIQIGEQSYAKQETEGAWSPLIQIMYTCIVEALILFLVNMFKGFLGDSEDVRKALNSFFSGNKGAGIEVAKMATEENRGSLPSVEPTAPLGDLGSMIGKFLPILTGFLGGNNNNSSGGNPAPPNEPSRRQPTGFFSRKSPPT